MGVVSKEEIYARLSFDEEGFRSGWARPPEWDQNNTKSTFTFEGPGCINAAQHIRLRLGLNPHQFNAHHHIYMMLMYIEKLEQNIYETNIKLFQIESEMRGSR